MTTASIARESLPAIDDLYPIENFRQEVTPQEWRDYEEYNDLLAAAVYTQANYAAYQEYTL